MILKRVFVPGVFDVFHIGHLNYLKRASEFGDYLVVAVQEDRAVERAKKVKLVNPLPERIALIQELRFVDDVVSYIDVYQGELLKAMSIDVFVCGEDYGNDSNFPDQVKTLEYCYNVGIEVSKIPRTVQVSSTSIRNRLRDFWDCRALKEQDAPAGVTVLGSFGGDENKIRKETEIEKSLILSCIGDRSDIRFLDLACGDGRLLAEVAPLFNESVGVDYAPALLEIAKKKVDNSFHNISFVVSDAVDYCDDRAFDVVLMSGLLPYLDDVQVQVVLKNLSCMTRKNSICLVRTSVGIYDRINVINQFSSELADFYTAYYRTCEEVIDLYSKSGWVLLNDKKLYQHRLDTAVWWMEFARSD